jgi:aspartate/methionine/tyrosine aminotransferase
VPQKAGLLFASRTNWDFTPNPLSVALARRRAAGQPVLDLTRSNPTECGFRYDSPAILTALGDPAAIRYEPDPRGLLKARQAVCCYYADRGDQVSPDKVILTTSTSEAYSFVFRLLCNPGDEVLVPQPSYPLFDFLADLNDVRLARYPLLYDHGWQIDLYALAQALTSRTRAVLVVNPNNPTGNFCSLQEMAKLSELCVARGVALIADEVFLDYPLGGGEQRLGQHPGQHSRQHPTGEVAPPSFAGKAGALTFTLSGLSKIAGLPQMKAAWMIVGGPDGLAAEALARLEVIADTYLSMNAPVQHALPALLQQRHALQDQIRGRVRENLAQLDRQVAGCGGAWQRLHAEGGWCAVLRLPAGLLAGTDEEFAITLLEREGVSVHPGHFYEFGTEGYVVVSTLGDPVEFREGIARMLHFPAG